MNETTSSLKVTTEGFQHIIDLTLAYLPRIAAAVLLLLLGWLLARLLRVLVVRGIGRLDLLWQRLISRSSLVHLPPRHPPTRVVGELVFWLLMLVTLTLVAEILELGIFGVWLNKIVTYLPVALSGLLIVLVGYVVSSLVRDLVVSATGSAGLTHGDLMGRTAQVIILLTAIIIGVDQIGIDIGFLSEILGIILATTLGGIALAFGLGARTHVSNVIAANQMRQLYQVGDRVRIADYEGRIMDITVSRVMLETAAGSVDVPARLFDEQVSIIIEKGN